MASLITGGAGFVGQHLANYLTNLGEEVFLTSHSGSVGPSLDVTNRVATHNLISSANPTNVYHLAGIAFVPHANADPELSEKVIVEGTANVAAACAALGRPVNLVVAGSAFVYGTGHQLPVDECTETTPDTMYGKFKFRAEACALEAVAGGQVALSLMRPFNHIGPGQSENFVVSDFAKQLVEVRKGRREPVIRVGNLAAQRDFTDVRDIVCAYHMASSHPGVFNLCSGNPVSIQHILNELIRLAKVHVRVESEAARVRSEADAFYGSAQRARQTFGWEPKIALDQTLKDTLAYWDARL